MPSFHTWKSGWGAKACDESLMLVAGTAEPAQRGQRGLGRVFVQIDSSTAASQLPSEFPAWDWRGLTGPCLPDPAARLESCQTPYAQQCILPSSDKAGSKSKTLGAD